MSHSTLIIIIMTSAGFLGGITNYFMIEQEKNGHPFLKNVLMGICASLLIPLFLNTISSNLIVESTSDNSKLLILFGFCLVASLSSKTFIQSLSKRLLNEVKKTEEKVDGLKKDMEPLISKETESFEAGDRRINILDFDDDTKRVLEALGGGKYAWRTPSGIAKEIDMASNTVLKSLDLLLSKRLAVMTRKKGRWGLTSEGRAVYLENISK